MKSKFEIDPTLSEEWVEFHVREMTPKLQQVIQILSTDKQLWGYDEKVIKLLDLTKVYSFESINGKVYAKTDKRNYYVRKKIYELLDVLPPDFVKISRAELVNLKHLDHLELTSGGTIVLKLKNGMTTFVSRRCVKNLRERLGI